MAVRWDQGRERVGWEQMVNIRLLKGQRVWFFNLACAAPLNKYYIINDSTNTILKSNDIPHMCKIHQKEIITYFC